MESWVKSNKAHALDPTVNCSDREFNWIAQKSGDKVMDRTH